MEHKYLLVAFLFISPWIRSTQPDDIQERVQYELHLRTALTGISFSSDASIDLNRRELEQVIAGAEEIASRLHTALGPRYRMVPERYSFAPGATIVDSIITIPFLCGEGNFAEFYITDARYEDGDKLSSLRIRLVGSELKTDIWCLVKPNYSEQVSHTNLPLGFYTWEELKHVSGVNSFILDQTESAHIDGIQVNMGYWLRVFLSDLTETIKFAEDLAESMSVSVAQAVAFLCRFATATRKEYGITKISIREHDMTGEVPMYALDLISSAHEDELRQTEQSDLPVVYQSIFFTTPIDRSWYKSVYAEPFNWLEIDEKLPDDSVAHSIKIGAKELIVREPERLGCSEIRRIMGTIIWTCRDIDDLLMSEFGSINSTPVEEFYKNFDLQTV